MVDVGSVAKQQGDELVPQPLALLGTATVDLGVRPGDQDDRAQYGCACGYLFEARVTASVTCPHCGAGQAW